MDDELRRRLDDLGEDPGPTPDPSFAQRLGADLRSQAYFTPAAAPTPAARPLLLRPAFVLGAVLVVAVAVSLVLAQVGDDAELLAIEDSAGATVILPGGESVAGASGVELPDGAVVEVAPEGFAIIDGIVVPAGARATIVDGIVELVAVPSPTAGPSGVDPTPTPPVETAPTPTELAVATPTTAPTSEPTARPTATPAPTATPVQAPTATPIAEPTPDTRPTSTPRPEPTAPVFVDPQIVLERQNLGPARARLTWTVTADDRVRGFEVRIRRGDTVRTAAVIREAGVRELTVERPERERVFYRVLAVGEGGEVIARSNEVRVTNPPADG
ncbi:MAG: hypothetical protein AAF480_06635 [Actinomycetota bacterium]